VGWQVWVSMVRCDMLMGMDEACRTFGPSLIVSVQRHGASVRASQDGTA
jgi:hypothetical protein